MVKEQDKKNEDLSDEEVEKKLDALWENWSSRRSCEQKHTPEYIKKRRDL